MTGTLLGIARHPIKFAPCEEIGRVHVSIERGIEGDARGAIKPGGRGRRQVSMMTQAAWRAAMAELGLDLRWSLRRVNLLLDGMDLPREGVLRIGEVQIAVLQECDPCIRMEAIAPGLQAALTPDWRGGALGRVLAGGDIAVGDVVVLES